MILPKRRKAEKHKKAPQLRSPSHLQWVRGHECAIAGRHECKGRIQAAHVRNGTDGGMGVKPSDCFVIPLCEAAHEWQHFIGEQAFELATGIKMRGVADALWRVSPHRRKAEAA